MLADRNICCDTLALFNTVLTQEIMEDLRPKYIYFNGEYCSGPQNYPEHMASLFFENITNNSDGHLSSGHR